MNNQSFTQVLQKTFKWYFRQSQHSESNLGLAELPKKAGLHHPRQLDPHPFENCAIDTPFDD